MSRQTRRDFLQTTTLAAASAALPYWFAQQRTMANDAKSPNERPKVGCIGNGGMGSGDASAIHKYGDIVALCDVDSQRSGVLNDKLLGGKAEFHEDYRKML
ncbi:MAG: twin-arginine translocation signal domain-containing protein, partial [Planctomycetaceae bacterium]|nr:twin-arginine translocation signal domain-containing protein [Planctomycetaceae bacterium]